MLSLCDKMHLEYLINAGRPLWGGHLERGELISDPNMQRWIELGYIVAVGRVGYVITEKGRHAVTTHDADKSEPFAGLRDHKRTEMACMHPYWQRNMALADGWCSMCQDAEINRLRLQSHENAEFAEHWKQQTVKLRSALRPFAELARNLDGAPNLIGLLTEEDFRRAAEAFGGHLSGGREGPA